MVRKLKRKDKKGKDCIEFDLEEEIKKCTEIIEKNPSNSETYNNRGNAKAELGRYEEAIEDFSESLKIKKNAKVYSNRGTAKAKLGRYEEAIEDYDKALKISQTNGDIYKNRGNAKFELDIYEEAIEDFTKALEIYNESLEKEVNEIELYNTRGIAKDKLGRYEEAIEDYKKVIERESESEEAYNNMGISKANLGRHEEAIKDYIKSANLGTKNGKAYYNMGISKANLNRYEEAIKDYTKAIDINPSDAGSYNNRGNLKAKLGKDKEAMEDFIKAGELDKKNPIIRYNIGDFKEKLGRCEEAIEDYKKVIQLNPNGKENYINNSIIKLINLDSNSSKKEMIYKFIENEGYQYVSLYTNFINLECVKRVLNEEKISLKEKIKENFKKSKLNEDKNKIFYMYKSINKNTIFQIVNEGVYKNNPLNFNDPFDPYIKRKKLNGDDYLGKIRVSCFSESYENQLMWAHYAKEHKGICFGYEISQNKDSSDVIFEKIDYSKIETLHSNEGKIELSNESELTIKEMFFKKINEWKYEKEWRMLHLDEELCPYYKGVILKEVYFGLCCSSEDINLVKELVQKLPDGKSIKFYKMEEGKNLELKRKEYLN